MDRMCFQCPISEREKHQIALYDAIEHFSHKCPAKQRMCRVQGCTFQGDKKQMQKHEAENLVRHNQLLVEENAELTSILMSKAEDLDFTERIQAMWTQKWQIDDFSRNLAYAKSQGSPLLSPPFYKHGIAWRLMLCPTRGVALQLLSKKVVFTRIALAFEDDITTFVCPVFFRHKEMVGGNFAIDEQAKIATARVGVVVLDVSVEKRPSTIRMTPERQENEEIEDKKNDEASVTSMIEKLEEQGVIRQIISRAKEVARNLPKDFGRGGRVGQVALNNLDVATRKVFEARIRAPESLGEEVDHIVSTRFMTGDQKTQIDKLYGSHDGSNETGLNLRVYGNMSSYISGSIIMNINDMEN